MGSRFGYYVHPRVFCDAISCDAVSREVDPRVSRDTISCDIALRVNPRVSCNAASYKVDPRVFYNAIGGPSGTS